MAHNSCASCRLHPRTQGGGKVERDDQSGTQHHPGSPQAGEALAAETDGYTLPVSRPSHPVTDGPMLERDRILLCAHREEVEAAEREASEAPIRDAEVALKETHRKLAMVMRERLLAEVRDPDVFLDQQVATIRMTEQQAEEYNLQQFRTYREQYPDIYWTEQLVDQVGRYFDKNELKIVSTAMIKNVIERFEEAGLLPERPEDDTPGTVDESEPQQVEPPQPELIDGWDIESGEPKKWTPRALDRLSSTEYRRALHLDKAALSLPNIGPGFGTLSKT